MTTQAAHLNKLVHRAIAPLFGLGLAISLGACDAPDDDLREHVTDVDAVASDIDDSREDDFKEDELPAEGEALAEGEQQDDDAEPLGFIYDNQWNCVWICPGIEIINIKPVCTENYLDAVMACKKQGPPLPTCTWKGAEWTGEWC